MSRNWKYFRLWGVITILFGLLLNLVPPGILLWGAMCLVWLLVCVFVGAPLWMLLEELLDD